MIIWSMVNDQSDIRHSVYWIWMILTQSMLNIQWSGTNCLRSRSTYVGTSGGEGRTRFETKAPNHFPFNTKHIVTYFLARLRRRTAARGSLSRFACWRPTSLMRALGKRSWWVWKTWIWIERNILKASHSRDWSITKKKSRKYEKEWTGFEKVKERVELLRLRREWQGSLSCSQLCCQSCCQFFAHFVAHLFKFCSQWCQCCHCWR